MRVDAIIGEGGFATIYRVQDQTTNQVCCQASEGGAAIRGSELRNTTPWKQPIMSLQALFI